MEGFGAAAETPSLLSYLTDVTEGNHSLRSRVMSYFELSLLVGLALGGLTGAQLWHFLSTRAFSAVAVIYILSACLLVLGAVGSQRTRIGTGNLWLLHGAQGTIPSTLGSRVAVRKYHRGLVAGANAAVPSHPSGRLATNSWMAFIRINRSA